MPLLTLENQYNFHNSKLIQIQLSKLSHDTKHSINRTSQIGIDHVIVLRIHVHVHDVSVNVLQQSQKTNIRWTFSGGAGICRLLSCHMLVLLCWWLLCCRFVKFISDFDRFHSQISVLTNNSSWTTRTCHLQCVMIMSDMTTNACMWRIIRKMARIVKGKCWSWYVTPKTRHSTHASQSLWQYYYISAIGKDVSVAWRLLAVPAEACL